VRLISERTRNAPLVIEKERVNFSASALHGTSVVATPNATAE
jgi:hypothetical protein